jgi:hypothetical protein
VNITHQGDILFATWFTYDDDGSGMWLVMPDAQMLPSFSEMDPYYGTPMTSMPTYSGTVYRTTGPAFSAQPFDSTKVGSQAVGSATFQFSGQNDGSFSFTVGSTSRMLAITKQVFGMLPDCGFGGTPSASPNFSDLWWRAPAGSESGWGLNIAQQGDVVFATWFTYDTNGKAMWLVMPDGVKTGSMTYAGALYSTRGPAFDGPWDGTKVASTQVGTATLAFTDASNGTFSAAVDGTSISKPITRQVYASPTTVCR